MRTQNEGFVGRKEEVLVIRKGSREIPLRKKEIGQVKMQSVMVRLTAW